jgi:hypothetical protein
MATALQNGDILACRVWNSLSDQAAVNTYNFSIFGVSGGAVTDQDLSNALDLLTSTFYTTYMSSAATYDGVQTYFVLRSGALPAPVKTISSSGPGLTGPPTVPPNSALVLKYNTPVRGPGGRGRVYLPFAATAQVAPDGRSTVAMDVLVNSFASAMLVPFTLTSGGSSATAVWSLLTRHPSPAPPTTAQITQAESSQKFGQMHKRGSYGRPNASPI